LIHEYPLELGLPPVSGVIAEGEAGIYLNEACDQALAELLDVRQLKGPDGLRVLADMVVEDDWSRLRQNLITLYQKVRESGRSFDELLQVTQAGLEQELKKTIISPAELIDTVEELLRFSETQKLSDTARSVLADFTAEWPHYRDALSGDEVVARLSVLMTLQKKPALRQNIFKDRINGIREMAATLLRRWADQEAARRLPFVITMLATIDRHYREAKREVGLLDFNDQQLYARELLSRHVKVAAALRRDIRYLLVDEFQDTNSLQLELIQLLLGPESESRTGRWMAVGDIKQSIYRFRGAEAGVIHNLEREFQQSGRAVIPLTVNYRSNQVILDFAIAGGTEGRGSSGRVSAGRK
jgi:ATP-dependent helicase/nuclease subunit A